MPEDREHVNECCMVIFQALIDEDRLLSRLEVLENQLHAYSKVLSVIYLYTYTFKHVAT